MALLIVFGGLSGTGKSAIAQEVARQIEATYLRIDSIEQAMRDSGVLTEMQDTGYRVAHVVAEDNLRLGRTVVADCVNPIEISREAWMGIATRNRVNAFEIEVKCSDLREHQHRVENRQSDVPGLRLPTWQEVRTREYEPWEREHIVVDTANQSVSDSVRQVLKALQNDLSKNDNHR